MTLLLYFFYMLNVSTIFLTYCPKNFFILIIISLGIILCTIAFVLLCFVCISSDKEMYF